MIDLEIMRRYTDGLISESVLLDEAADAKLQKWKLIFSKKSKEANEEFKLAKKEFKGGNRSSAKSHAKAAKKLLQELYKQADDIDDDELGLYLLEVVIRTAVPSFAGLAFGTFGIYAGTIIGYICGMKPTIDWQNNVLPDDVSKHKAANGTPDAMKPSISRTQAKTKYKRLMDAVDQFIEKC